MKDLKVLLTDFHYKKEFTPVENITAGVLYTVLGLPSAVYWAVAKTRNFLYKKRILKSYKSPLYTISVGNITTGGTGKTPITAEIANYLAKKGGFPAILSRGYGGKLNNKNVNVISDGLTINHTAIEAGDEPFWLSKHCKNTAVLTCSSRVKSAKFAKENLNCTALILDDGFQHLKLQRDLNILVVDSEKKFSNGCMLPLGALREPLSSIKRADKIVVVNKSFNDKKAKAYARFLRKKYSIPVFVCSMVPDEIYNIKTNEKLSDSAAVIAFSAISLIVSSIMIAIITYASVIERIKEIGVLRSLGARKRDVGRVFIAEAAIIGFVSAIIAIIVTLIINLIINIVLGNLVGISTIASLNIVTAIAMMVLCIGLNVIASLAPAVMASKKDPVVALRSE